MLNKHPNFIHDPVNGELFFLAQTLCTTHRRDFLSRGNAIVGLYFAIVMSSGLAREELNKKEQEGKIKPNSNIIIVLDEGLGGTESIESIGKITIDYGTLKGQLQSAQANLANQTFLMLYGNAEAYIADMVIDAYRETETKIDPYEAAIKLISTTRWQGKIHRIINKFGVNLGATVFIEKFKGIEISLLKHKYDNPLEFLESLAEVRHRLVHYPGHVDKTFLEKFPNSGLSEGGTISLPGGATLSMHLFFVQLTDVIDEAFASKFGWERKMVIPEKL